MWWQNTSAPLFFLSPRSQNQSEDVCPHRHPGKLRWIRIGPSYMWWRYTPSPLSLLCPRFAWRGLCVRGRPLRWSWRDVCQRTSVCFCEAVGNFLPQEGKGEPFNLFRQVMLLACQIALCNYSLSPWFQTEHYSYVTGQSERNNCEANSLRIKLRITPISSLITRFGSVRLDLVSHQLLRSLKFWTKKWRPGL